MTQSEHRYLGTQFVHDGDGDGDVTNLKLANAREKFSDHLRQHVTRFCWGVQYVGPEERSETLVPRHGMVVSRTDKPYPASRRKSRVHR